MKKTTKASPKADALREKREADAKARAEFALPEVVTLRHSSPSDHETVLPKGPRMSYIERKKAELLQFEAEQAEARKKKLFDISKDAHRIAKNDLTNQIEAMKTHEKKADEYAKAHTRLESLWNDYLAASEDFHAGGGDTTTTKTKGEKTDKGEKSPISKSVAEIVDFVKDNAGDEGVATRSVTKFAGGSGKELDVWNEQNGKPLRRKGEGSAGRWFVAK